MAIEVKLPDLGEEVEDVTISRWLVQEGDEVSEGAVLLEVATDKVDTEVPAPASGTLLKISVGEGELVAVNSVLAIIGAVGEDVGADVGGETPVAAEAEASVEDASQPSSSVPVSDSGGLAKASPVAKRVAVEKGIGLESIPGTGPGGRITKEDVLSTADNARGAGGNVQALPGDLADVASLSVRRLAAKYNLNLAEVAGGRPLSSLTRYDLMAAAGSRRAGEPVPVEPQFLPPPVSGTAKHETASPATETPAATTDTQAPSPVEKAASVVQATAGEEMVKHSRMRQLVARNTSQSIYTAPHVTTMWDVNMSAVLAHRKAHKAEYAASGVNLTVTAYFIPAIVAGLKAVPAANASWSDEGVIVKRYYNIGMAVALPRDQYGMGGLIVPVIRNAGDLNLMGTARVVNELAEKARKNQLSLDELQGGTFTLSNYGTSGSRFQTPVIVQPQVGILGVGAIEKRPVVVSQGHPLEANTGDFMAFLPMTTLGFSYDHRVLDGATADAFCAAVKDSLENWS
jgi:2-oxoglutarate dehydrogenase E2 component (dihydrolipoamide succinyltransferase)